MKIKVVQEREDGSYEFTANLSPAQHKFLIEFAIQELLRRGLSVPLVNEEDNMVTIVKMESDETNETPDNPRHSN